MAKELEEVGPFASHVFHRMIDGAHVRPGERSIEDDQLPLFKTGLFCVSQAAEVTRAAQGQREYCSWLENPMELFDPGTLKIARQMGKDADRIAHIKEASPMR